MGVRTTHIFNYTIGNDFFDCLDFSDIKQGKAKMDLITGRNLVFTLRREKQLPSEALFVGNKNNMTAQALLAAYAAGERNFSEADLDGATN